MRDRVRTGQPCDAPAAGEHHENRRGGRDVDRAGGSAEPRVQGGEAARQRAVGGRPVEHLLGIAERRVRGGKQHQHGRARHGDGHQISQRRRAGQMLRETGERRIQPERLFAGRHQQDHEQRAERGDDEGEARPSADRCVASACTRGGGSSCAARASASPPPITGSMSRESKDAGQHGIDGRPARERGRQEAAPSRTRRIHRRARA